MEAKHLLNDSFILCSTSIEAHPDWNPQWYDEIGTINDVLEGLFLRFNILTV